MDRDEGHMEGWKRVLWIGGALSMLLLGVQFARKATRTEPGAKAQALGFASVDEMIRLTGRGYASKADYLDVKARSAGYFAKHCKGANSKEFRARCQGQRVSWSGFLVQHDGSSATVAVLNDDGTALAKPLSIDSRSLAKAVPRDKVGRIVTFDGEIARHNRVTYEVERTTVVAIESDDAAASRQARRALIEAEASLDRR